VSSKKGATGGEEGHVAIPTVTNTSVLMYHLKAEKALSGYNQIPLHQCPDEPPVAPLLNRFFRIPLTSERNRMIGQGIEKITL